MFYITASSAAAAADIMLDPSRLMWIRQISTWWFVFDVLACLTSCTLRPLTNRESFGLIFYVYNWFGRTLVIVFVAHQTIKVGITFHTSIVHQCTVIHQLCQICEFHHILLIPLACFPMFSHQLRNHVLALGPQGEAIAARLSNFFLLVIAGHTGFIVLYTQSVLRCYRLLNGLNTLPYYHRERTFDVSAVGKLALLGVVLLFILRSSVCIPTPGEDTKYAALNTRPPQEPETVSHAAAPEDADVEMDEQV